MASFPSGLASFSGFTAGHTLAADNHAAQHNLEQGEILAAQTKIGTGSSTPTANTVLVSTSANTSSWAQVNLTTMMSGVLPVANGGNGTTSTTGTGSAVFSSSPTLTGGGSWSGSPALTTPTIADFTNATHTHAGSSTGGLLGNNVITGSMISNYKNSRNDNGSNSTETTAIIQSGWVALTATAASTVTGTITFPTAFTNVPIVIAVYGGDTVGASATLGSGGINVKQAYADAVNLTTTNFLALAATRDSTNWTAGNTIYIQWIAIGV